MWGAVGVVISGEARIVVGGIVRTVVGGRVRSVVNAVGGVGAGMVGSVVGGAGQRRGAAPSARTWPMGWEEGWAVGKWSTRVRCGRSADRPHPAVRAISSR
jgi:hypothetical protein